MLKNFVGLKDLVGQDLFNSDFAITGRDYLQNPKKFEQLPWGKEGLDTLKEQALMPDAKFMLVTVFTGYDSEVKAIRLYEHDTLVKRDLIYTLEGTNSNANYSLRNVMAVLDVNKLFQQEKQKSPPTLDF